MGVHSCNKGKLGDGGKRERQQKQLCVSLEQIYFWKLHLELWGGKENFYPPEKRRSFWQVIIPGVYYSEGAAKLLQLYVEGLEKELAGELSKRSIAYWVYVYRRLGLGSIGPQKDGPTIYWTRAIFEAAVQKYGRLDQCGGIGISTEVDEQLILSGILFDASIPKRSRDTAKASLKKSEHVVLLSFGLDELRQIYRLEALAYEIWRTIAMMRIVGKEAPMIVDPDSEPMVRDGRSSTLEELVRIFDERGQRQGMGVSRTGTSFGAEEENFGEGGFFLIPQYNVGGVTGKELEQLLSNFNLEVGPDFNFNFVWCPFQLKNFYRCHVPFREGFKEKYDVSLEEVMAVLGALLERATCIWAGDGGRLVAYWQRGYEQISSMDFVVTELRGYISRAVSGLGLTVEPDKVDVSRVIRLLGLTDEKRANIDLVTHGPHYVFLPFGRDRFCIDYAWIGRLLYNLFYDVKCHDGNFKAQILEDVVQKEGAPLTNKPCKGDDGTFKQVDASYRAGDTLVIAECKAKARSFAFFRGDSTAINYRNQFIKDALEEVDGKAKWLVAHPKGTTHDICEFSRILPVVVTPFVEYIPSLDDWYWIEEGLTRILTAAELKEKLSDGTIERASQTTSNVFMIEE